MSLLFLWFGTSMGCVKQSGIALSFDIPKPDIYSVRDDIVTLEMNKEHTIVLEESDSYYISEYYKISITDAGILSILAEGDISLSLVDASGQVQLLESSYIIYDKLYLLSGKVEPGEYILLLRGQSGAYRIIPKFQTLSYGKSTTSKYDVQSPNDAVWFDSTKMVETFTEPMNVRWYLFPASYDGMLQVHTQCMTFPMDVKLTGFEVGELSNLSTFMNLWDSDTIFAYADEDRYHDDCNEEIILNVQSGKTYLVGVLARTRSEEDNYEIEITRSIFNMSKE